VKLIAYQKVTVKVLGLAVTALLLTGALATAQAGPEDRMDRQIRVFEKALDTMLVDSPNWLVANSEPSFGYYLDDHGVVFSFRASLVSDWGWGEPTRLWNILKHRKHRDDDDDDDWESDREAKRQERLYERGKEELLLTLLDFGEILTTVADDEWVEISVKLRDAYYFRENDLRRLEMRAKASDLRSYYDGRMGEKEAMEKIQIEES
jgi:hypothetical protein